MLLLKMVFHHTVFKDSSGWLLVTTDFNEKIFRSSCSYVAEVELVKIPPGNNSHWNGF